MSPVATSIMGELNDANIDICETYLKEFVDRWFGWLDEAGATLATTARLRSREEHGTYLDAVSAVHWRLRARIDPESAATGAVSMARWQVERFAWPEDVTPLALAEDGDLALDGQPVTAAPPAALLAALRRIRERHRATLWLLGQARDWDAIDLNL